MNKRFIIITFFNKKKYPTKIVVSSRRFLGAATLVLQKYNGAGAQGQNKTENKINGMSLQNLF